MMNFQFKDFLKLMFNSLKNRNETQPAFLGRLCSMNMRFDTDEEDDDDQNHPFSISEGSAKQIWAGSRPLKADYASLIINHYHEDEFVRSIDTLKDKRKESIVRSLLTFGVVTEVERIGEDCASIFYQFLEAAESGKSYIEFPFMASFDGDGNLSLSVPINSSFYNPQTETVVEQTGIVTTLPRYSEEDVETGVNEMPFVSALKEAYEEDHGSSLGDDYASWPGYHKQDYLNQRSCFFRAEIKRRQIRETYYNGDEQFANLKAEIYKGVRPVLIRRHNTGLDRCHAVMDQAACVSPNASLINNLQGFIEVDSKQGICHMLVNDRIIKSWVDPYE